MSNKLLKNWIGHYFLSADLVLPRAPAVAFALAADDLIEAFFLLDAELGVFLVAIVKRNRVIRTTLVCERSLQWRTHR